MFISEWLCIWTNYFIVKWLICLKLQHCFQHFAYRKRFRYQPLTQPVSLLSSDQFLEIDRLKTFWYCKSVSDKRNFGSSVKKKEKKNIWLILLCMNLHFVDLQQTFYVYFKVSHLTQKLLSKTISLLDQVVRTLLPSPPIRMHEFIVRFPQEPWETTFLFVLHGWVARHLATWH